MKKWIGCLIVFLLASCGGSETINIGFIGTLSGKFADLGSEGRNGVMLAVEDINKAGGIKGKKIHLIIKNNKNDNAQTLSNLIELQKQNPVAIIGPMTSQRANAVVPFINENRIFTISPTVSSEIFSGLDDFFIKMIPSNKFHTIELARYMFEELKIKTLSVIYDENNESYSLPWAKNIQSEIERLGGRVLLMQKFNSQNDIYRYSDIARAMLLPKPDAVFLISAAIDMAHLVQKVRALDKKIEIIGSGWSMTEEFIYNSGKAGEGTLFTHFYNKECTNQAFLDFKSQYQSRFSSEPTFAALFGYESVLFLKHLLLHTDDYSSENLLKTMKEYPIFKGIPTDITVDEFGDTIRGIAYYRVKENHFVRIK